VIRTITAKPAAKRAPILNLFIAQNPFSFKPTKFLDAGGIQGAERVPN
jgi:hypothetical protein